MRRILQQEIEQPSAATPAEAQPTGSRPIGRFGHSAVAVPGTHEMLVFGGREGDKYHNDAWTFNAKTRQWREILPPPPREEGDRDVPAARAGHSAVVFPPPQATTTDTSNDGDNDDTANAHNNRSNNKPAVMLVFGGAVGAHANGADLWMLDLKTKKWTLLDAGPIRPDPNGTDGPPSATTAVAPAHRKGHSAIAVDSGRMLVFGGCGQTSADNAVWQWDLNSQSWSAAVTQGSPPSPRIYHVAEQTEKRTMLVFGGRRCHDGGFQGGRVTEEEEEDPEEASPFLNDLHELNLDTNVWRAIESVGAIPSGRMCCSSLYRRGMICILFGGSDSLCDDNFELDTEAMRWRRIEGGPFARIANHHNRHQDVEGGKDGSTDDDRTDTTDSKEEDTPGMCTASTSVLLDNTIAVFGGHDGTRCMDSVRTVTLSAPTLKQLCRNWLRSVTADPETLARELTLLPTRLRHFVTDDF